MSIKWNKEANGPQGQRRKYDLFGYTLYGQYMIEWCLPNNPTKTVEYFVTFEANLVGYQDNSLGYFDSLEEARNVCEYHNNTIDLYHSGVYALSIIKREDYIKHGLTDKCLWQIEVPADSVAEANNKINKLIQGTNWMLGGSEFIGAYS